MSSGKTLKTVLSNIGQAALNVSSIFSDSSELPFLCSSKFGTVKQNHININILTYDKIHGNRCYKGIPYNGTATNKSGNTIVTLNGGKISKFESTTGSMVYTFRDSQAYLYGAFHGCIYMNGIYLDDQEFKLLFPELAVMFTLKDIHVSPMYKDQLLRFSTERPTTVNKTWDDVKVSYIDDKFAIGVLEIW